MNLTKDMVMNILDELMLLINKKPYVQGIPKHKFVIVDEDSFGSNYHYSLDFDPRKRLLGVIVYFGPSIRKQFFFNIATLPFKEHYIIATAELQGSKIHNYNLLSRYLQLTIEGENAIQEQSSLLI